MAREAAEKEKRTKVAAESDNAEGLVGHDKVVYRVMRGNKTGYDITKEDAAGRSRGELLNARSKAKSDRLCM